MVIKMYYLNNFFLYSILGYIIESVVYSFFDSGSGILYGFWTPVYGIGVVTIIFLSKIVFEKIKLNNFYKSLTLFLIGSIILSFLEFIGGVLIENFFGIVYWDYSGLKYNIGNYIALEMALVWGISSILFYYLLKPISDKIVSKIPKYMTYIFIFLFLLDLAVTLALK